MRRAPGIPVSPDAVSTWRPVRGSHWRIRFFTDFKNRPKALSFWRFFQVGHADTLIPFSA
jgi:hypothetical protein